MVFVVGLQYLSNTLEMMGKRGRIQDQEIMQAKLELILPTWAPYIRACALNTRPQRILNFSILLEMVNKNVLS